MAHAFDTGLATPQRTAIRDAIVAKLAPLKKTANPPLYVAHLGIKTIPRPFQGDGDELGVAMLATVLAGQAPSIAIALGRLTYEARGGAATELGGELEIGVYCASTHGRGWTEGRLFGDAIAAGSDSADPGIFTMLEHVRQLLAGQELGVAGVSELRPESEDEVLTFEDVTIWEQRYRARLEIEIRPFRAVTQKVTEIQGEHSLSDIPDGHEHDPLITTLADLPDP